MSVGSTYDAAGAFAAPKTNCTLQRRGSRLGELVPLPSCPRSCYLGAVGSHRLRIRAAEGQAGAWAGITPHGKSNP